MMFILREEGQGLVEYGLILVLIAVAVVVLLAVLGTQLSDLFSRVAAAF
jgi:pilus assembly protein Flp/PilA